MNFSETRVSKESYLEEELQFFPLGNDSAEPGQCVKHWTVSKGQCFRRKTVSKNSLNDTQKRMKMTDTWVTLRF